MAKFDIDLSSEENNVDNDNEQMTMSMKVVLAMKRLKKKKIGKKRDKQAQWEDQHINDRIVNICKNEYLINIL